MGHIVRRGTPEAAAPREPLPTTKISELRLDALVRETREGEDVASGTPIEISTIAMPRLQRPDGGQITVLRGHETSGPTRQMVAEPDPEDAFDRAATAPVAPMSAAAPTIQAATVEAALRDTAPRDTASRETAPIARYPEAPVEGVLLPRVLLVALVLSIAWLGASLIYAVR